MIVAERILRLRGAAGEVAVPVRIFAPERDGTAFRCRYEIGWPEGAAARTAAGVDAVQALVIALKLVGTELYTSEAHAAGRLRWEREGGGYGFPVPGTIRDLLVGDDARFEG